VKELRERRDREAEEEEKRRKTEDDSGTDLPSRDRDRDDDRRSRGGRSGAQIAPPPSLSQPSFNEPDSPSSYTGPSVGGGAAAAAKIMAKYGYKEGQGLGKKEQGMSTALQVQKTSFRIGRIIHEKDMVSVPNPLGLASSMAAYNDIEDEEYEDMKPPVSVKEEDEAVAIAEAEQKKESTLAEILRNPSNILLLKNMVAPGEVDDDLEPEVKEECSKYGQVNNVTVFQMPDMDGEDAIRIFVEFASVDPAVKGFMDLDGRFFGGRQVKASFYNADKYNNLELTE
jgi:splicing factor 45